MNKEKNKHGFVIKYANSCNCHLYRALREYGEVSNFLLPCELKNALWEAATLRS